MEFDYKGFMMDFRIADKFGTAAIKDTFRRAHRDWKNNVDYYGSLILTLNHLIWYHYEQGNMQIAELYNSLWEKADNYAFEHFSKKDQMKLAAFLD